MLDGTAIMRKAKTLSSEPKRVLLQKARKGMSLAAGVWLAKSGVAESLRLRPADAIPPDPLDLLRLYTEVRRLRPEHVLELGAGCSTNVLATAVRANGRGHVTSVDGDARWADIARDQVPAELRPYCDVHHCRVTVVERDGSRALTHENLPPIVPDFIYLDGPAPVDGVSVCRDLLDLEPSLRTGTMVIVDGREDNVAFLRRRFRRSWRIRRSAVQGATKMVLIA